MSLKNKEYKVYKSSKSGVYFTLIAPLSSDQLQLKYAAAISDSTYNDNLKQYPLEPKTPTNLMLNKSSSLESFSTYPSNILSQDSQSPAKVSRVFLFHGQNQKSKK